MTQRRHDSGCYPDAEYRPYIGTIGSSFVKKIQSPDLHSVLGQRVRLLSSAQLVPHICTVEAQPYSPVL